MRSGPEPRGIDRDVAPTEHPQPFLPRKIGDALACLGGVVGVLGQENEACRVCVRTGQLEIDDPGEELVRNLDEDPRSVAGVLVCALGSAVIEVLQSGYRLVHEPVRAPRRQVRQKSYAARIVLERRS